MRTSQENIAHGVLLIGLGVLALIGNWWPGLLIVLGVYFSLRNLFLKSYLRLITTVVIYTGIYISVEYSYLFTKNYILPIILLAFGAERIIGEFFSLRKSN